MTQGKSGYRTSFEYTQKLRRLVTITGQMKILSFPFRFGDVDAFKSILKPIIRVFTNIDTETAIHRSHPRLEESWTIRKVVDLHSNHDLKTNSFLTTKRKSMQILRTEKELRIYKVFTRKQLPGCSNERFICNIFGMCFLAVAMKFMYTIFGMFLGPNYLFRGVSIVSPGKGMLKLPRGWCT